MAEKKKIKPFADPGFTPIKNHIFDYIMPDLAPNAWKVLCVAVRQTLGWEDETTESGRKEEDEISYSQFLTKTGIGSKSTLSSAIKECLEKQYLKRREIGRHPGTNKPIYSYRLNKDYEMEIPSTETVPGTSTESVLEEDLSSTEDVLESGEASTESVQTKQTSSSNKIPMKEKKQSDSPVSSEKPVSRLTTFQKGDDYFDVVQKCAPLGGDHATPAHAGGADALVEAAIICLCGGKPPKKGSGTWHDMVNTLGPVHKDWGLHDMEVDEALDVIETAITAFLAEKPTMAVYRYSSFPADYGQFLSGAMKDGSDDRYAYTLAHAEASQAARKERIATKATTVEDCPVGAAVKRELAMQMRKPTFDTYVRRSSFVCDDGTLTVTAPDEVVKGWLEDRLMRTIERTVVGVAGGQVKIKFEIDDE